MAGAYGTGIPLGYLPQSGANFISVLIEYRGANAAEIERTITVPLENVLAEVPGITEMFSLSDRERCRIGLRFAGTVSPDDAYLNVRETVHGLYPDLPDAVQRPVITASDPRDRPVFAAAFGLSRETSADDLKRLFEAVPGAGEVEAGGEIKKELRILLDREKAAAAGIDFFPLLRALGEANISGGFGPPDGPAGVVDCRFSSPRDVRNLRAAAGPILGDVAGVRYAGARRDSLARIDGEERLVLSVRRAGDANTILLTRRLRNLTENIPRSRVLYDQGAEIFAALKELLHALLFGMFLISVLTAIFFRRPLLAAAVCMNLPFSFLIALASLRAAGFELDVMTLSGLAVGAGLAVDSGVILGEEFLSRGLAAGPAVKEARAPIIYSALTTVCVFVPLIFSSPHLRLSFGGLALAVAAGVSASVGYVFLFMPVFLAGLFGGKACPEDKPSAGTGGRAGKDSRPGFLPVSVLCRGFIIGLSRRRGLCLTALLLLGGAAAFTAGSFTFQAPRRYRGNVISFTAEFESGLPLEAAVSEAASFEDGLRRIPGAVYVSVKYERERASFDVEMEEPSFRPRVIDEIRRAGGNLNGGFLYFPDGEDGRDSFDITLRGPEVRLLRKTAADFAEELRRGPGAADIVFHFKEALPSKTIVLQPGEALRAGVEPVRAAALLHRALSAPVADKLILPEEELDIQLTFPPERTGSVSKILAFPVEGREGRPVRLSAFAAIEERPETGKIYRSNRRRSVSFSVLSLPGDSRRAVKEAEALAARYPFPGECTAEIAEAERREKDMMKETVFSLLLAFVLLGLVLAFEFEGLRIPLVILAQLPFCLAPPALLLRLFGTDLTAPAAIGFIMTLGIGVNNSLLVFRRDNRKNPSLETLAGAYAEKARPMAAAALTTAGGVLPLLCTGGAETGVLAPLSLVIAAGAAASPLVLLIFITLTTGRLSCRTKGRAEV